MGTGFEALDKLGNAIRRWRRNPVFVKEVRGRIRGWSAYQTLTGYLLLMGLFVSVIYAIHTANLSVHAQSLLFTGRLMFGVVVGTEIMMVMFLVPTLAARAISGEREDQTFELLRTTLLSARELVWGKMNALMTFVLMLLVSTAPFVSMSFLFGGVSPVELALMHEILIVAAFGLGAVSMAFSARFRRSSVASLFAYGFTLVMGGGIPILALVGSIVAGSAFFGGGRVLNANSPLITGRVIDYLIMTAMATNLPATALLTEIAWVSEGSAIMLHNVQSFTGGSSFAFPSLWMLYTVFYVLMGLLALELAIRWVRRPVD